MLVLGAGGGVGLAAIGVARALGCRVLGVASTEEKRAAALAAGAEAVLDPAAEPVKDAARAWAGGTGVDLVVDPVGGALAEPSLRALGDRGRYLVIGFASGPIPSFPLNQVLLRNRTVIGIDWGIWAMQHADEQRALLGRPARHGGRRVRSTRSRRRSTPWARWRRRWRTCWGGGSSGRWRWFHKPMSGRVGSVGLPVGVGCFLELSTESFTVWEEPRTEKRPPTSLSELSTESFTVWEKTPGSSGVHATAPNARWSPPTQGEHEEDPGLPPLEGLEAEIDILVQPWIRSLSSCPRPLSI